MHMLHLLRHAKSSWKEDVGDHERRLNKRGREAALSVGQSLLGAVGGLDLVLCSSAARTRETLELALGESAAKPRCLFEDELYLADATRLISRLHRLDEGLGKVLLVGHNPGIQELAVSLAARDPSHPRTLAGKFPTAARASFEIATPWRELGSAPCRLVDYAIPGSRSAAGG